MKSAITDGIDKSKNLISTVVFFRMTEHRIYLCRGNMANFISFYR